VYLDNVCGGNPVIHHFVSKYVDKGVDNSGRMWRGCGKVSKSFNNKRYVKAEQVQGDSTGNERSAI